MLEFEIEQKAEGQLLRQYLRETLQLSSRFIKKLTRKKGYLSVNGEDVTVRYLVKSGDLLQIKFPEESRSRTVKPEQIPLTIVYEDDWLIVLNKVAGMPSIPSQIYRSGTVANGLLAYYDEQNLPYTIHIVTRLDKDTSGLMLVAKHQYSHSLLSRMQKDNQITRIYEAIATGIMTKDEQTINMPIRRKPNSIIEREVAPDGQKAITHIKVKKRYDKYTYVSVRLETGRTHQIRVHFATLGHPLLGDSLYGGDLSSLDRQALHCSQLQFQHPFTKEQLHFTAKSPPEWRFLCK